jgi:hypothetical protein
MVFFAVVVFFSAASIRIASENLPHIGEDVTIASKSKDGYVPVMFINESRRRIARPDSDANHGYRPFLLADVKGPFTAKVIDQSVEGEKKLFVELSSGSKGWVSMRDIEIQRTDGQ